MSGLKKFDGLDLTLGIIKNNIPHITGLIKVFVKAALQRFLPL